MVQKNRPSQPHRCWGQALGGWRPVCKTLPSELQAFPLKQENPEPARGRAGQGGSPEPKRSWVLDNQLSHPSRPKVKGQHNHSPNEPEPRSRDIGWWTPGRMERGPGNTQGRAALTPSLSIQNPPPHSRAPGSSV